METESIKLSGHVSYILKDNLGQTKRVFDKPNLITTVGKAAMSGLLAVDIGGTAFDYIAIGSGSGQTASSTTLATEISTSGGTRRGGADVTATQVTTTTTNDTTQFVTTFTFTGPLAITESGIFNATPTGTMLCYQDFAALNVVNGDTLQVTWKVKFA